MTDMTIGSAPGPSPEALREVLNNAERCFRRSNNRLSLAMLVLAALLAAHTFPHALGVPAALEAAQHGLNAGWQAAMDTVAWVMASRAGTLAYGLATELAWPALLAVWSVVKTYAMLMSVLHEFLAGWWPFAGATVVDSPGTLRMTVTCVLAVGSVALLPAMVMLSLWRRRVTVLKSYAEITAWFLFVGLGIDICGWWAFHMKAVLGGGPIFTGTVVMTVIVSFVIICLAAWRWTSHFNSMDAALEKLGLRAMEQADEVVLLRVVIVLAVPLVMMAGLYVGTTATGTLGGGGIVMLLALAALTRVVHNTLGWGYVTPRWVMIPLDERPQVKGQDVGSAHVEAYENHYRQMQSHMQSMVS